MTLFPGLRAKGSMRLTPGSSALLLLCTCVLTDALAIAPAQAAGTPDRAPLDPIPVSSLPVSEALSVADPALRESLNPELSDASGLQLAQSITAAGDGTGTTVDFDAATQTYTINGGTQIDANLFHSFRQFGLSAGEIANFLANPDVANILARVTGGNASVIDGLLQVSGGSNANLFILNPAGVLLGRNANLNLAGSFSVTTASGLTFGDEVFNATGSNDYAALTGNPNGYVFLGNEGVLLNEADLAVNPGESLTLGGSTVINTGTLEAPEGNVSIVAVPEEGILRISQEGLVLSLAVSTDQLNGVIDSGITPLDLPALLAGDWGGDATTVSTLADGTVVLGASPVNTDPGAVTVAGNVDVSGNAGGQVQVLGEDVALTAADINADGTNGGGTVLIGGEYLGQGDIPTAQTTTVDSASVISADALLTGDGGRVIVWADDSTSFGGSIFARGGALSGDGGFVETSGAVSLAFAGGAVDASAANGAGGQWLLDPADITIEAAEATVIETALGAGTSVELTTVGAGSSQPAGVGRITSTSGNGNITLTEDIDVGTPNNATFTLRATGDITAGNITTYGGSIDFEAYGNIEVGVINTSGDGGQNGGFVELTATFGYITVNSIDASATFSGGGLASSSRGGNVTISANRSFRAVGKDGDGISIQSNGELSSTDVTYNSVPGNSGRQRFYGGKISISHGGTEFIYGITAPQSTPFSTQVDDAGDESLRLEIDSDFSFSDIQSYSSDSQSGSAGAIISRNSNGTQRAIYVDQPNVSVITTGAVNVTTGVPVPIKADDTISVVSMTPSEPPSPSNNPSSSNVPYPYTEDEEDYPVEVSDSRETEATGIDGFCQAFVSSELLDISAITPEECQQRDDISSELSYEIPSTSAPSARLDSAADRYRVTDFPASDL